LHGLQDHDLNNLIIMSFKKDRYLIIKKTVSDKLIKFIYDYFLIKRKAIEYMYKNNVIQENILFGTWKDEQVPNVYSVYADFVMETLLVKLIPILEKKLN